MRLTSNIGIGGGGLGFTQVLGVVPITGLLCTDPPYDIYCVGIGASLLTSAGVTFIGDPTQFPLDGPPNFDQQMDSGGTFLTEDAAVFIDVGVTEDFTFQFTALWQSGS